MSPLDTHRFASRQGRLRELMQSWGRTTAKTGRLGTRAATLETQTGFKPSLFHKLMRWVEQLAGLRQKELEIISEIDAIERRHTGLRKGYQLRKAMAAKPSQKTNKEFDDDMDDPKPKRRSRFWIWFFVLAYMIESDRARDKRLTNG